MSQENVELVRSIVADWARGDYSSVGWADPEIEFTMAGSFVVTRGPEAMARRWGEFLSAWQHLATVPEDFIKASGDRVLVLVRFVGRGRTSGIPVEAFFGGQLFTVREGKIARLATYSDRQEAFEAAGLPD
jgi:ketosteroid isomerase-like protein